MVTEEDREEVDGQIKTADIEERRKKEKEFFEEVKKDHVNG